MLIFATQAQITKLPHADTTSGNYFGTAVALDGHRAIVGASGESSCAEGGGAAYIFELTDSTGYWQKTARLVPRDCEAGLAFGRKVAISDSIAIIAASQEYFATKRSNAVYVYEENDAEEWIQTARLTGERNRNRDGAVGAAVAVHGHRVLFTTAGDPTPDSQRDGTAYIYVKEEGLWNLDHKLAGSGGIRRGVFGENAVLHADFLAVASSAYFSRRPGSVHLFQSAPSGVWDEVTRLGGIEGFFISMDLYENELIVGQAKAGNHESGQATLFTRDSTGTWLKTATLVPPTPYRKGAFGTEVALYKDRALVVGYDEQLRLNFNVDRVVYIYARRDGKWHYQGIIDIGEAAFGTSIDLYENTALIGAASASSAGHAYVIRIP